MHFQGKEVFLEPQVHVVLLVNRVQKVDVENAKLAVQVSDDQCNMFV